MSTNNFNGEWNSSNIHTEKEREEALENISALLYTAGWLLLIIIAIPYWIMEKILKGARDVIIDIEESAKELKNDKKSAKELFQGLLGGIFGSAMFWALTISIILIH